jgi:preprotein translocase subunit SecD
MQQPPWKLLEAKVIPDPDADPTRPAEWAVRVKLDDDGQKLLAELTALNIGVRLAYVVDRKVRAAPLIEREVKNGVAIIPKLGPEEAQRMASGLENSSQMPDPKSKQQPPYLVKVLDIPKQVIGVRR